MYMDDTMNQLISQIREATLQELCIWKRQVENATSEQLSLAEKAILLAEIQRRNEKIITITNIISRINKAHFSDLYDYKKQIENASSEELSQSDKAILLKAIKKRNYFLDDVLYDD